MTENEERWSFEIEDIAQHMALCIQALCARVEAETIERCAQEIQDHPGYCADEYAAKLRELKGKP